MLLAWPTGMPLTLTCATVSRPSNTATIYAHSKEASLRMEARQRDCVIERERGGEMDGVLGRPWTARWRSRRARTSACRSSRRATPTGSRGLRTDSTGPTYEKRCVRQRACSLGLRRRRQAPRTPMTPALHSQVDARIQPHIGGGGFVVSGGGANQRVRALDRVLVEIGVGHTRHVGGDRDRTIACRGRASGRASESARARASEAAAPRLSYCW